VPAGSTPGRRCHCRSATPKIDRLKEQVRLLEERLAINDQETPTLAAFRSQAVPRLAAQYEEITRLHAAVITVNNVRNLWVYR
jgi:hypothetical protein